MSCCDGSAFEIINLSGTSFSVTSVSASDGSVQQISTGDVIDNNGFLLGFARAGSGTKGKAKGSITITTENGKYSLKLPYKFSPDNSFGACPCTSSAQDDVTEANYVAKATVGKGKYNGEASIVWMVTSQLGS